MSLGLQPPLSDDMNDAYREWRRQSAAVDSAYRHWLTAPATAAHAAYAAYVAALDGEEYAAEGYARSVVRYLRGHERERLLAAWLDPQA
jgi:hypothetical protein